MLLTINHTSNNYHPLKLCARDRDHMKDSILEKKQGRINNTEQNSGPSQITRLKLREKSK